MALRRLQVAENGLKVVALLYLFGGRNIGLCTHSFVCLPACVDSDTCATALICCGLTPELTGAGSPIGLQGTNIGHQNREAMANVGVRVERFVRLGRVGTVLALHSSIEVF
jgi:hypothetical protein